MGKLTKDMNEILPEFQKFLINRSMASEKNIPFLAYWVSRYLTFARKRDISADDYQEAAVIEYLNMLRADEKILDWQHRQADDAVKLYYFHYLGKSGAKFSSAMTADDVTLTIKEVRRLIRLRHYSFSTERTYLQWIERFFSYALTGGNMSGTYLLMAELLYGAGLRLMELARLRVKDIDLDANTLFVRSGKGDKDRSTVLPSAVKERLREHLKGAKEMHEKDL